MAVSYGDPLSTNNIRSVCCLSLKDVAENACTSRLCLCVHHSLSVYELHQQYAASRSSPACAYANHVQDHACCVDQTAISRCLIPLHSSTYGSSYLVLAFTLRPYLGETARAMALLSQQPCLDRRIYFLAPILLDASLTLGNAANLHFCTT